MEPVTAVALAVAVLHERLALSPDAAVAIVLASCSCVAGVVRLSWGDLAPTSADPPLSSSP